MANNKDLVELKEKKFSGLACNKRAFQGAVLAVIAAILSGGLLVGNAANISLFQSFNGLTTSLFGNGLGQIFVGNTAQSIINTAFAIGNVALEVGVIAPIIATTIHKAYGWSQYRKAQKSAKKFLGNTVENGVTIDKELSETKDLINSVLYSHSVNGANEYNATLDVALTSREQLNETKNPFKKIFHLHKAIAYEDCNNRVITKLTNRLAKLCYQRNHNWKYLDKSGKRNSLTAEEIKSRETEMKMIQDFLSNIINKNDSIDPYVKTIVRQVKKHRNNIELITAFDNMPNDTKENINKLNEDFKKGRNNTTAKNYVLEVYNRQPNSIEDHNNFSTVEFQTSVGGQIIGDTRLQRDIARQYKEDTISAYNEVSEMRSEVYNMIYDISKSHADVRKKVTDINGLFDIAINKVNEINNTVDFADEKAAKIERLLNQFEKELKNIGLKKNTVNTLIKEFETQIDKAKQSAKETNDQLISARNTNRKIGEELNKAKKGAGASLAEAGKAKGNAIRAGRYADTAKTAVDNAYMAEARAKTIADNSEKLATKANEARTRAELAAHGAETFAENAGEAADKASNAQSDAEEAANSAKSSSEIAVGSAKKLVEAANEADRILTGLVDNEKLVRKLEGLPVEWENVKKDLLASNRALSQQLEYFHGLLDDRINSLTNSTRINYTKYVTAVTIKFDTIEKKLQEITKVVGNPFASPDLIKSELSSIKEDIKSTQEELTYLQRDVDKLKKNDGEQLAEKTQREINLGSAHKSEAEKDNAKEHKLLLDEFERYAVAIHFAEIQKLNYYPDKSTGIPSWEELEKLGNTLVADLKNPKNIGKRLLTRKGDVRTVIASLNRFLKTHNINIEITNYNTISYKQLNNIIANMYLACEEENETWQQS